MSDGRLERALHTLDIADRACPVDARRSRLPRAQILATLGRLAALAPALDAIVADPASTADERGAAARLHDQLELARSEPPPSDTARRTARELREQAASLIARDPRAARTAYLRAWQLAHPNSLALAGAARASALAGDLAGSRRLYERAAADAEREAGEPIALELADTAAGPFVDHGTKQAAVVEERLPWPATDPTHRSSLVLIDRATHTVERVLDREVGAPFATGMITPYLAFDPAGHTVIASTPDELRFIDIDTARVTKRVPLGSDFGPAWALTPDGKQIARWFEHGVELIDVATGAVRQRIAVEPGSHVLAISPDGRRLATTTDDVCDYATCGSDYVVPRVRVFEIASGKELGSEPVETLALHGLAFTGDGRRIVVDAMADHDGDIVVLDGITAAHVADVPRDQVEARAAALGIADVVARRRTVAAWPVHERVAIEAVGITRDAIGLRLPDRLVAWATAGNRALYPAVPLRGRSDANFPSTPGVFSQSGTRFACAIDDQLEVYDVPSGRQLAAFAAGCNHVRGVALDPPASRIAIGCYWSGNAVGPVGGLRIPFAAADHQLDSIALAGTTLAWADRDHGIALLAGTGRPIALGASTGPALAVSRDGRWLAAGTGDGLAILDLAKPGGDRTLQVGSRFSYVQFSPDSTTVFVIGATSSAYDIATGAKRYDFAPYTGSIFAYAPRSPGLAFAPAAAVFASPTERGELVLVRTADGRELGKIYAWEDGTGAVIAPDGRFALLGGARELPDAMCRAGAFALPLAACRDRFETPDLLATLLAGDPR